MNFLAHIYLSGNNDLIKIGNFMADGIKGKDYMKFSNDVKMGILLHRQIDSFTDFHTIYRKSKHRLHEKYGHYSGVITDILYDHFLAKNWNLYSDVSLNRFVSAFYKSLQTNQEVLTESAKSILLVMTANNWLGSYKSIVGIEEILFQMNFRTKHKTKMHEATKELKLYYSDFEAEFTEFFEDIRSFSANFLRNFKTV